MLNKHISNEKQTVYRHMTWYTFLTFLFTNPSSAQTTTGAYLVSMPNMICWIVYLILYSSSRKKVVNTPK